MIKISADSIEQALLVASKELRCSCVDLEYEVLQYPSNGIFGMGKKEARIVASIKDKQLPKENCDINEVVLKIEREINELFGALGLDMDKIEVSKFNGDTLFIHFKGKDAALLIGEKGYRYKAISYMLFNWINAKYGFGIRLEIESFLASQEKMIDNYLEGIIRNVENSPEFFITKPLDGILAHIALKKLRAHFPNKRITIKTNEHKQTYIAIAQDSHE